MKIAVLGCSGAMGGFFTRYFLQKGNKVIGIDPERSKIRNKSFEYAGMDYDSLANVDVTLVAVPMDLMFDAIKKAIDCMKLGKTVVEVSSLKEALHQELKMLKTDDFSVISIHPLFGQGLRVAKNATIAVVPFKDESSEIRIASRLFPDFRLRTISCAKHDEFMSLVISLTHAINIAYAKMVDLSKYPELSTLMTPLAGTQFVIARAVLSQNSKLIAELQCKNKHTFNVLTSFARIVEYIAERASKGKEEDIQEEVEGLKDLPQDILFYTAIYNAKLWDKIQT